MIVLPYSELGIATYRLLAIPRSREGGQLTESGPTEPSNAERRRSFRRSLWTFGRARKGSADQGHSGEEDAPEVLSRSRVSSVAGEMLALAAKTREAVVCTFIEVRGAKSVEQSRGQDDEDEATAAHALGAVFRRSDVLARWGAKSFVVLSVGPGPESDDVERRMTQRLQPSAGEDSGERALHVSVGRVVHMPWQDEDLEHVVERADQEMLRLRRLRQARDGERDSKEP
jgi:GGDEF domain-containing protein